MKKNEQEINMKIKKAYTAATPDLIHSILSSCNDEKGRVISMEKKRRSGKARIWSFVAAAAAILLVLGTTVGTLANGAASRSRVFAIVSLDVNPSIELAVDRSERVINVSARNQDAERIVDGMDLSGSSIDVAVNALIGSMLRNGYLSEIANSILVSVDNMDATKAVELQKRLAAEIEAVLSANFGGAVITQTVERDEETERLAGEYGITLGKAQLINSIIAAAPRYTFEELAARNINELNILYNRHANRTGSGRVVEGSPSENAYIGRDRAIEIALDYAGISASEAMNIMCALEFENGRMVYEIEFRANGFEFDADIDATTGDVLSFDKEYDDDIVFPPVQPTQAPQPTANPVQPTANPTNDPRPTPNPQPNYIGEERAKQIAFDRAGVSASEVTRLRVQLKRDDGRMVYDIEFNARGYEYDVEIDALSGAVLEFSRELEDDYPLPVNPTSAPQPPANPTSAPAPKPTQSPAQPSYIGEQRAKQIAFERAGVSASEVTWLTVELDRDDGIAKYEVDFKARGYEYDIDINAITGAVLKFERELDDDVQPAPTQQPSGGTISQAEAKRIAFQKAGVSESAVVNLQIELDNDDGRLVYEIEFDANGYEYSFEIDASSGAILDYDVDND